MARMLVALACLVLGSCVMSPVPLESGDPAMDSALTGIWKSDLHGDPMLATIREESAGHLVAEVMSYSEPGPAASIQRYEIVLARFGDERYMSIRGPDIAPDYFLARYVVVNEDRFCVFAAFSEALAKDLEAKRLPGEVKPDRHMATVQLAADAQQLREYFGSEGARAFSEMDEVTLVFQRTKSTELPPPKEPGGDPDSRVFTPCRP